MRRINGTALIVAALVATICVLAFPMWSYADRSGTGQDNLNASTVATQWGPLSALDREFITKVRLAGLWEGPAGQQAIERAPNQAMVECADHLLVGHADLDKRVRSVAAKLGVELPNQPTEQQQGWLNEMTAASGAEYPNVFANLLRNAHGKFFSQIAQVRHSTRNTLVRQLASDANLTVLDHITMLEKIGTIDFDAIANEAANGSTISPTGPPPPDPGVLPPPAAPAVPDDLNVDSTPSAAPLDQNGHLIDDSIPTARPEPS